MRFIFSVAKYAHLSRWWCVTKMPCKIIMHTKATFNITYTP
jgi:hypothetical protein